MEGGITPSCAQAETRQELRPGRSRLFLHLGTVSVLWQWGPQRRGPRGVVELCHVIVLNGVLYYLWHECWCEVMGGGSLRPTFCWTLALTPRT